MARFEGSFVPTTFSGSTSEAYNIIALVLNTKDSGFYVLEEFVNGQVWFPDPALNSSTPKAPTLRQVIRKVFNIGALPNGAGTLSIAHGIPITADTSFTRIYGTTTEQGNNFLPIPYASAVAADIIELYVDATDIHITVGKDRSMFTKTYVVLEYIQE